MFNIIHFIIQSDHLYPILKHNFTTTQWLHPLLLDSVSSHPSNHSDLSSLTCNSLHITAVHLRCWKQCINIQKQVWLIQRHFLITHQTFKHGNLFNMGSSIKDVRTEGGEGGQAECRQKRTRGEGVHWKRTSAFTHVVIWFKEWASALTAACISNRAGQTDVTLTDTSCTTTPALSHQHRDCRGVRWDSPPLLWHCTSVALADGRRMK